MRKAIIIGVAIGAAYIAGHAAGSVKPPERVREYYFGTGPWVTTTRAPSYPCQVGENEWASVSSPTACTKAQDEAFEKRALADPWGPNPYIFEAPRDRYTDRPMQSMETWLFCKTILPATDRFPAYGWPMPESP